MSVRALQARVECNREVLDRLWRTHRVFNERLPRTIGVLMKMRGGRAGDSEGQRDLYRRIGEFITGYSSQNAEYLMNSVSIVGWQPGSARKYRVKTDLANGTKHEISGESWASEAAALSAAGTLLYRKEEEFGDLPGTIRQMLAREAVMVVSGHQELLKLWTKDREDWIKRKAEWESGEENRKYLALRPEFEAFELAVGGKATKRRERWHKYVDWLRSKPSLAAWRGGEAKVHAISVKGAARIARAKPWKTRKSEAAEFWEANPELKALDRLHGHYEREFIRRRQTKTTKLPMQGFKNRPTFTLPHATRHPRWFVFNAPQSEPPGYRHLDLDAMRVELLLLAGEKTDGKHRAEWTTVHFTPDPRLSALKRTVVKYQVHRGKAKGLEKEKEGYRFFDRHLMRYRPAKVSGARLVFRDIRLNEDGSLRGATPYLMFTVDVDDEPLTALAKEVKLEETGELTKHGKKKRRRRIPVGLVTCAVDLGVRHVGFATVARWDGRKVSVLRSRNLWLENLDLVKISKHKRALRKLRSQRGAPVGGERSHVGLQEHIDGMGDDRFKKAAREIVDFALNLEGRKHAATGELLPRADVLILENLETLLPDAEKERGINRMIVSFNRGHIVDRVREMARDAGLKVWEVNPMGTSQVCSRCGALGRRYTIRRDEGTGKPEICFGEVEKLFACAACGYMANSDHNASVNLHRRFVLDDDAVKAWQAARASDARKREERERIENALRPMLRVKHGLEEESPF